MQAHGDLMAALFGALPAAIMVYEFPSEDPTDGFLVAFNDAAVSHTGVDLAPLVGQSTKQVLAGDDASLVTNEALASNELSYSVATGAGPMRFGGYRVTEGPAAGEYQSALFPLGDRRMATLFRRIDSEAESARALAWAVESLETANRSLDNFASTVAHDLKNPLAGILGNAELVQMTAVDLGPDASVAVERIVELARMSSTMIDDLLVFNRAPVQEQHDRVDLAGVVAWAAKVLDEQIAEAGATVKVAGWASAQGNEAALRQVVLNLLANSLRYRSDERDPEIQVQIAGPAGETGNVVVSVIDNGLGIAPAEHESVFGWGARGKARTATVGSGIGLAACRSIVSTLGGSIEIIDQVAPGTRIDIVLQSST